jgi:hypothetical protein
MMATEASNSSFRRTMRSRIWAWTVTSRAVVGSSAIRRSGFRESAMAIMARWRIPPENSCGNWRARSSGLGIPTLRSISIAWAMASDFEMSWWARRPSTIWSPTR